jgi:L-ribulose-5-phosphate 3-epimerase UlaE
MMDEIDKWKALNKEIHREFEKLYPSPTGLVPWQKGLLKKLKKFGEEDRARLEERGGKA